MKTLLKWLVVGGFELILCFGILGTSANLVSSPSNLKVWLGVFGYFTGLVIIPGLSVYHVTHKIHRAKVEQKQLQATFPQDDTSWLELLDSQR
ncbi:MULTISPECIES: hypothetical protein [Arthrospira]|jgi:hypothetical protein|uniref:Uncharacterized protein n=1 Tax=Limnospira platensis NIES-46 TaxID=1236695 RepID=A0A5M3T0N3_LIMPL|nr:MULTISPECIES: hypothetical protein [Arthrospira]AMW27057.1 hypothetical protein AP285_02700 [Arthrospira platensis YZ]KDR57069.1 hypothetical protein APPUASWS_013125 [Arthrospira platensis str. Paraca]MBD2670796.1 hypothetical protein [Arthrospira platensis FACHB-439]MBD2711522.1 hypothetical protein [Arthrospira platensis FACHB-835]MDF2211488.1 hypothetical protein [Arthrospira platensis NCB002]MDT9181925.1 hypothetical protein [Limnospira sp. PMC 289.06]MDT9296292.1 hypothetical protein